MVLLETVLKIKAGLTKAKGKIPKSFKINPYNSKYDIQWNQLVTKLETLSAINCKKNRSLTCKALKSRSLDQSKKLFAVLKKNPIFYKLNQIKKSSS